MRFISFFAAGMLSFALFLTGQQTAPSSSGNQQELQSLINIIEKADSFLKNKEYKEAVINYKEAIELLKNHNDKLLWHVTNNLAWVLATCPDASVRNGSKAIQYSKMSTQKSWVEYDTLAAAYAESGEYTKALENIGKALLEVPADYKNELENRKKLFKNKTPYREKL